MSRQETVVVLMVSLLTRRLLRDWKNLTRYNSHSGRGENVLFHLKPQDSNLHIWNLVLSDPSTSVELYLKLYIGDEQEPAVILICLTPNDIYPTNRRISLTHLNYILLDHGLVPFLQQVWSLFFGKGVEQGEMIDCDKSRLTFAWNRIINKDFRCVFPELVGNLVPGDYQMVKEHCHRNVGSHGARESQVSGACTGGSLIACDGSYRTGTAMVKRRSDATEHEHIEHRRKRAKK